MISTLLDKIASFYEKGFLIPSFLPALIFLISTGITIAWVIGLESVWYFFTSSTTLSSAGVATAIGISVIIFAYLLNALNSVFIGFWSGTTKFFIFRSFFRIGEFLQGISYNHLRISANKPSTGQSLINEFRDKVDKCVNQLNSTPPDIDRKQQEKVLNKIRKISNGTSLKKIKEMVGDISKLYSSYALDSLRDIYYAFNQKLGDRAKCEKEQIQQVKARLDQKFGGVESIRATDLGNVIEAYNAYSYKRYRIEAEVLWPRLRKVIPSDFLQVVEEPRILLAFAVTMATLSGLYGVVFIIIGPWLLTNAKLWTGIVIGAFLVSYFFYRVGVIAANQYGVLNRACFDLFRLELMYLLFRPHPKTMEEERRQWNELSQLLVYGDTDLKNFDLRAR